MGFTVALININVYYYNKFKRTIYCGPTNTKNLNETTVPIR